MTHNCRVWPGHQRRGSSTHWHSPSGTRKRDMRLLRYYFSRLRTNPVCQKAASQGSGRGRTVVGQAHAGGFLAEADSLAQSLARKGVFFTRMPVDIGPNLEPKNIET